MKQKDEQNGWERTQVDGGIALDLRRHEDGGEELRLVIIDWNGKEKTLEKSNPEYDLFWDLYFQARGLFHLTKNAIGRHFEEDK